MFEIDVSDPKILWLTITNIALGAVTVVCVVVVAWGAATAALAGLRRRWGLDLEPDDRAFATPGLRVTTAGCRPPVKTDERR
ncbi:MAG: hypothetical protein EPN53_11380 [Acidobacteria bacterium]|nr:MAG: hypothetical protein EPN53_11380 [Acidobacteriota bacterium]